MSGERFAIDADGRLQCRLCRDWKAPTTANFVASGRSRLGVSSRCRSCSKVYTREWKKGNARLNQANASRRSRFEERLAARRELAPVIDRAHVLRGGIRQRAAERGVPFASTLITASFIAAWLLKQRTCECCGVAFRFARRGAAGTKCAASASIDRFVPERGYVPGNIHLLCARCNEVKGVATSAELRRVTDWMDRVTGDALGSTLDLPLAPARSA